MRHPRVSVAIATYNYGQFICQALDSVRDQTFSDWEAVIVDDGSTDDTRQIVRPYLKDGRFHYVQLAHAGVSAAKSEAVRQTTGEFVALLDADDVWLPEKLEKQVQLFDRSEAVDIVYCPSYTIDGQRNRVPWGEATPYRGDVLAHMFLNNFVCFSSAMVRRRVFESIGYFDVTLPLAIDWDFWLRAAMRFQFDYLDEKLVEYRTGHTNLSKRAEERLRVVFTIMNQFLDVHGGRTALPAALVRRAYAETYCSLAYLQRSRSRTAAFSSYCRAIRLSPMLLETWRGVLSLALPESGRRALRRLKGERRLAPPVGA